MKIYCHAKFIWSALKTLFPRNYLTESRVRIRLPAWHRLDFYQKNFKNYNKKIGIIASVIFKKYPNASALDIGANVGDVAITINKHSGVKVYVVEGNGQYLKYLSRNVRELPQLIVIPKFLCPAKKFYGHVKAERGTGSIDVDDINGTAIDCVNFDDLSGITQNVDFKLIKIDTDGLDFDLLDAGFDFVTNKRSPIYIEFDVINTRKSAIDILNLLEKISIRGYSHYVFYDNCGNFRFSSRQFDPDLFLDVIAGLYQNHIDGGRLPYFDLLLLHHDDIDIFDAIKKIERRSVGL